MQPTSPTSIRRVASRYLTALLAVVTVAALFVLAAGLEEEKRQLQQQEAVERALIARGIAQRIDIYRQLVEGIARDPEVANLLNFGDAEAAQRWGQQINRRIPQSIGVALVTTDGEVRGNPRTLRIGAGCETDLKAFFRGDAPPSPPVHREVTALSHFDIIHKVKEGDETLGVVFASFSLEVLRQQLEATLPEGGFLLLEDGHGHEIARAGDDRNEAHTGDDHPRIDVPGSDWQLHVMTRPHTPNPIFLGFSIGAVILFGVVALILTTMSYRLTTLFQDDLRRIREQLRALRKGYRLERDTPSGLAETDAVMGEIGLIMSDLESHHHELRTLSLTDPLTGLLNRRGLDEQLRYAVELAGRAIPCYLVLFDLDRFKACNDRHGHAVGDEVLQCFARAMGDHTRATDHRGRLGGDEFVVVLVNYRDEEIERWFRALTERFEALQHPLTERLGAPLPCGTSAGAVAIGDHPGDLDALFQRADAALYRVKQSGRGRIAIDGGPA